MKQSFPGNLAEFFATQNNGSDESSSAAIAVVPDLEEQISKIVDANWTTTRQEATDALNRVLDVDIFEIMIGGWSKLQEFQPYLDEKRHPPDEISQLALVKQLNRSIIHQLKSFWTRNSLEKFHLNLTSPLLLKARY